MQIAIVNGSTRKQGSTGKILNMMKQNLDQKADVETSYYDLADYEIKYCTGCRVCYRTGICSIKKDGIEELSEKIKKQMP